MPEETIDPSLLEQTKNQIRKLVAEIAELAESDIQPAEFHVEFLNRAVAAVAASGGALWMLDGRGSLKLQHHLNFGATGMLNGQVRTQPHDALLGCMMQATSPQIIPPGAAVEGVPNAGNPTGFALILAPLVVDKQVIGLVEILMDPNRRAATQKSTLRFVGDLSDLAANFLKNRQMRQVMSQQRLWNQLEGFTHQVHSSLNLKDATYSAVNDGKRLVGCDRLSVCLKIGGRTMVEAVSGQEVVEQRANLIREMTKLCKTVLRSGEDLVYTGNTEGFAPDLRDALECYVDESGSKVVIVTLLHKPEDEKTKERVPFGCLVAEQIGDEVAPSDMHARTEVVARHASTALWNASEHDKTLLPLLKLAGSPRRFFRGRTFAKILAAIAAVVTAILVMTFVPWELTIEGRGEILPENRRNTYAPERAIVVDVPVEHGQLVKKGDLLCRLESRELERQLKEKRAEHAEAISHKGNLELQAPSASREQGGDKLDQIRAQIAEATIRIRSTAEQIEIIQDQIDALSITAPLDGEVTTWEVKKTLLNKPVEVGEPLVQVLATDGEWALEVQVPDDDMAPILASQAKLDEEIKKGTKPPHARLSAYFVTATDPSHRYTGFVRRIATKPELIDGKHMNKVTVGFSDEVRKEFLSKNEKIRSGAEVRARVECGQARLAYVLFRDVVHFFHESVMFRWPILR